MGNGETVRTIQRAKHGQHQQEARNSPVLGAHKCLFSPFPIITAQFPPLPQLLPTHWSWPFAHCSVNQKVDFFFPSLFYFQRLFLVPFYFIFKSIASLYCQSPFFDLHSCALYRVWTLQAEVEKQFSVCPVLTLVFIGWFFGGGGKGLVLSWGLIFALALTPRDSSCLPDFCPPP